MTNNKTCLTCAHRTKLYTPKRHICDLSSDFRGETRVTLEDTCKRWEAKDGIRITKELD